MIRFTNFDKETVILYKIYKVSKILKTKVEYFESELENLKNQTIELEDLKWLNFENLIGFMYIIK